MICAPMRMSVLYFLEEAMTSASACFMTVRSFEVTSLSSQKNDCESCTHSKYDTVTPPALARISGRIKTPFSWRIGSASGVVGALAASARIFGLTQDGFQ